jgi:predicted DsbA family dithiol-disulfide isomerase
VECVPAEGAGKPDADPLTGVAAPAVRIDYYTDPLCCWSWALEPVWQSIDRRSGGRVARRVILGGMIEGWSQYRDPLNDVGRPAQMAPHWFAVSQHAHVPINPDIWHVDPPQSSYPACVAVKAAGLQGRAAGEQYLRLTREAVMTRRLNIARREVLRQLARELAVMQPRAFDPERFDQDLVDRPASEAFADDLRQVQLHRIGRFPTLVFHGVRGSRIAIGYRPVEAMDAIIRAVSDGEAADAPNADADPATSTPR